MKPTPKIIGGVPDGMQALILRDSLSTSAFVVSITDSEQTAATRMAQLRFLCPEATCLLFPSWDCLPYDRLSPSLDIMAARMGVLETLTTPCESPTFLILPVDALVQYVPPRESLFNKAVTLNVNEHYKSDMLIATLLSQGYVRTSSVHEIGEFAVRGDIIDVFPARCKTPIRIDFFGDKLETLRTFDPLTQRTLEPISAFTLQPVKEVSLTPETIRHFRTQYRNLTSTSADMLYESISAGRTVLGMEHWLPLFFDHCETLIDYLPTQAQLFIDQQAFHTIDPFYDHIRDAYLTRLHDKHHPTHPLPPEQLYWPLDRWRGFTETAHTLSPLVAPDTTDQQGRVLTAIHPGQTLEENLALLRTYSGKTLVIACESEGTRTRVQHIFEQHSANLSLSDEWPENSFSIHAIIFPLDKGFVTPTHVVLSESDLFGSRFQHTSHKPTAPAQFFLEAAQLAPGDLVVHREHGIGRFDGLETIAVEGLLHDFLLLIYHGGDKLLLPVENIEMINRYGSDGTFIDLDRLGSSAWQLRKAKIKKRLHEVAEYLIQLAAERSLLEAPQLEYSPPDYEAFCARFPYMETEDQQRAIGDVLHDLTQSQPMDRLICGDVGFGKTEIALRAAFIAAANGRQVAIIVPTTLLCRQHYQTFLDRFAKTPYRIAQLSRLVSPREADKICQDLADGRIHIIIGTQALLAERVRLPNLGLVIIDEEHRLGVKQKEKLKQLKANVHVLTLSATPIPRTLQLSLAGIRQLSLIRTPPIDRLAVRTFVGPFDLVTLKEIIYRERGRGGQIYLVCPRIEDLGPVTEHIKTIAPDIRMRIAHGRLTPHELEDVMSGFYDRRFDLLLATNIIESGIDIPSANTLIVYRASLFGLAQLHQLRGRIGRSKIQGYAYLTFLEKEETPASLKRLEVIQSLDTLGAGFQLAHHDLELRGAGNIVGEEQSGHIREVGIELYHHLLEEAIAITRSERDHQPLPDYEWTPQINLGLAVLIPEVYIPDLDVRLGLYRRLAALEMHDEVEAFAAELIDRFGPLPSEVQNLLDVIQIKLLCRQGSIEKIDTGPQAIVLTLRNNTFSNSEGLIRYLQSLNGAARIRPDQKIVIRGNWPHPKARIQAVQRLCRAFATLSGAQ